MSSLPWASQLPTAVPLSVLLGAAMEAGDGAALCVFAPDGTVEPGDRRGYAALVIAYTRFDEPVAILDDGCTVLLIRSDGVSGANAAATRILDQAGRMGLASRLRVGVAGIQGAPADALRSARSRADIGRPGQIAGAA
jgi:hypothetical protein